MEIRLVIAKGDQYPKVGGFTHRVRLPGGETILHVLAILGADKHVDASHLRGAEQLFNEH